MLVPSGTVWAMSLLILEMLKVLAYFFLAYICMYIIGLGIIAFVSPIINFLKHK